MSRGNFLKLPVPDCRPHRLVKMVYHPVFCRIGAEEAPARVAFLTRTVTSLARLLADDEPPSSPVKTGHQKNVPFILHRLEEKINRMDTLLQDLPKKPDEQEKQEKQEHINDKTIENILVKAAKILNSYETELKKLQKVKDDLASQLVVFELKMGASNKPKTGTLKAVIISGAVILSALIVYLLL